jgi:glycosyltransferase involved in cell wall biosynthesis
MRALVVSNMLPSPADPGRGVYVRDQVAALRRVGAVDVDLVEERHGAAGYLALARRLRGTSGYDLVHAHFGLTAWPALAVRGVPRVLTLHGTDVRHPRSRRLTRVAASRFDLVAAASAELAEEATREMGLSSVAVLPCGVALDRFCPMPRGEARERLGLPPDGPLLLFGADPARAVKRFDRASEVAGDVRLLTLGAVAPEEVPLWVNAANAVLVPSESEGFGLAVLEALACDVPVLATPVGVHREALEGVEGTLCAEFDAVVWRAALEPVLGDDEVRIAGRSRAERWSSDAMAERVVAAWGRLLAG